VLEHKRPTNAAPGTRRTFGAVPHPTAELEAAGVQSVTDAEARGMPSWGPIAKPSTNRKKSQWDEVLNTLERKDRIAVKIVEDDTEKRNRYKSTLQTQAKNWGLDVRVRTDGNAIYAWVSREARPGRFPPADNLK
jgi:hypothetical protein